MTKRVLTLAVLVVALAASARAPETAGQAAKPTASAPARPVIVLETSKGTAEIELYPDQAPKTVERVLTLVRKYFYNGQRVHRVEPGSLVQFGDKRTRDMTLRAEWGTGGLGGSGKPIGAAEFSKTLRHVRGVVGMAHAGDPKLADSQVFINLRPHPEFNGKYTAFGRVISGMDVLTALKVEDRIVKVSVKE
jgi:peptidyl-prolyl cis-trans isomerase B (cyclophilin B)